MTLAEARRILQAYRPGVDRADDPEVEAALALARETPELQRWMEEQGATRRVLQERFRGIPVPAGLREQILAEIPVTVRSRSGRPAARLALAAGVMVLLAVTLVIFRETVGVSGDARDLETFRGRMVGAVVRDYRMSLESGDAQRVRSHLVAQQAPADYQVPPGLAAKELTGCGVLSWTDRRVSMICFRSGRPLEPGAKADVFLFVVSRNSVPNPPAGPSPEMRRVRTLMTASWAEGDNVYVLATEGDEEFLRGLL